MCDVIFEWPPQMCNLKTHEKWCVKKSYLEKNCNDHCLTRMFHGILVGIEPRVVVMKLGLHVKLTTSDLVFGRVPVQVNEGQAVISALQFFWKKSILASKQAIYSAPLPGWVWAGCAWCWVGHRPDVGWGLLGSHTTHWAMELIQNKLTSL